jgi:hypothetical protein
MKTKKLLEKKPLIEVHESSTEEIVSKTKKMEEKNGPLSKEILQRMKAYWRAANYLSVGQILN